MSNEIWGLDGWDWLELCSLAAIAIGALCDLFLRGKKLKCSPDENGLISVAGFFDKEKLESKRHSWEIFWEFILIMGLLGEIPAALHGISVAGEMKDRASTNELQVAVLSNETVRLSINLEGEKSNNLVLQSKLVETARMAQRQGSRSINPWMTAEIEMTLPKIKGIKVLLFHVHGREPELFAIELERIFKIAGWDVLHNDEVPPPYDIAYSGVIVDDSFMYNGPLANHSQEAQQLLIYELAMANIGAWDDVIINPPQQAQDVNTITVIVGSLPSEEENLMGGSPILIHGNLPQK